MVLEYFNYMYIAICTYLVNSMVLEYFEFAFTDSKTSCRYGANLGSPKMRPHQVRVSVCLTI